MLQSYVRPASMLPAHLQSQPCLDEGSSAVATDHPHAPEPGKTQRTPGAAVVLIMLTALQWLSLSGCGVSDTGAAALISQLIALTTWTWLKVPWNKGKGNHATRRWTWIPLQAKVWPR